MAVWPVVETVQADGVCAQVLAPAPGLDAGAAAEAERIGRVIAERQGEIDPVDEGMEYEEDSWT